MKKRESKISLSNNISLYIYCFYTYCFVLNKALKFVYQTIV